MAQDIRAQFRENPGIATREVKPDYARTVDLVTKAAIREMIIPSLLPVLAPIVVYFVISWVLLCSTAPSVCTYFVRLIVPRDIPLFLPADGFDLTNSFKQADIACSSPVSPPAPKILLSTNDM